jgi:nicotinamidase-related amidase
MSDPVNHLGLLLLDYQDVFLDSIPDRDRLLRRSCFAAQAAAQLGVSIATTEQIPEKLGTTTQALKDALPANTPNFSKNAFSAWAAPGLNRWIESNQIDHLLIAGLESSICVYQTAVQALAENVGVTLLSDCIGERRAEDRIPVLQQLLTMEAHVLPAETIFYSLLADANHPQFKAFTKLVKSAQD